MKILSVTTSSSGKKRYYFCGIKIFSKKAKPLSIEETQINYKKLEKHLAEKDCIKVAFVVTISAMFPAKELLKAMIAHAKFTPTLLIIPDLRFGLKKAQEIQEKTVAELAEFTEYIHIVPTEEAEDTLQLKAVADILIFPWIYNTSHYKYSIEYAAKEEILPILVNYGFFRSTYDRNLIADYRTSLVWKIFAETTLNLEEYNNYELIKGQNAVLTGYSKMDSFCEYTKKTTRKTVLLAPHHSVENGYNKTLALSNFYQYSELFLQLPEMYPQVDFIFRPHPALFICLAREEFWGQIKVDDYIAQMKNKINVIYSEGDDYFQEFANSDAIIQDCGSYLAEYFYTLKPQCYLLKSPEDIDQKFTPLGQQCLEHCYIAYKTEEIISFIDNVVIANHDTQKTTREQFAKDVIMLHYPNASSNIIEYLEDCLEL